MDFGGGLEVLGVEIFGRRGFSGFLEMEGILECDDGSGKGRVDILTRMEVRVDEYCEGG